MALTEGELELLEDTESDLVERKESLSDKDRICEAICAYANDLPDHRRPGMLFIGATDDGRPSGLAVSGQLLETMGAIRSDGNILPPPSLTVRKVRLHGADMAVIEVQPSIVAGNRPPAGIARPTGPATPTAPRQGHYLMT